MSEPEAWLSGPLPGVLPELMPAAHMLIQSARELDAVQGLRVQQLNARPGGAASVSFHLRHMAGAIDRLLTYARAEPLTSAQRAALAEETAASDVVAYELIARTRDAIDRALAVYRNTRREELLEPRGVGAKQLPSTVIGLLYHVAEHTVRHTGQLIATAKVVNDS